MSENNKRGSASLLTAALLTTASVLLVLVGVVRTEETKIFSFILGSVAMLTAIAYGFIAGHRAKFVLFWLFFAALFFILGSVSFQEAIWTVGDARDFLPIYEPFAEHTTAEGFRFKTRPQDQGL